MTKGRVLLAGLAGGVAMYFWASVAHMALPLASTGINEIQNNEASLLNSMQSSLGEKPGLYMYPSTGWKPGDSQSQRTAAMQAYDAKLVSNPSGLLIYNPPGAKSLTPGQLVSEFLVELLEAMLAVWLLAQTNIRTLGGRIGFVSGTGLLAAMPTNISYWIWYGFPANYTVTYMLIQIVGFALAGVAAAFVLRGQD